MKHTSKVLGFAAIIAAIGLMILPLTGCGDGTTTTDVDKVATPTANPPAGNYQTAQSVTLSTATSGAKIYYTTNGTAPTTSSTQYSSAISISATTTLKAFAVKEGMDDSGVLTATYTIGSTSGGFPNANVTELTMGKWANGDITTAGGEQWLKFTTEESQTSAYIHFMDAGTLSLVYVQLYNADGTDNGTRTSLGVSYTWQRTGLTANTVYYIKVTPYTNTNSGTYKIGVVNSSSSSTLPSITIPATGVDTLSADTWTDGTLPASLEKWYTFTPTAAGTQYIHFDLGTQRGLYVQFYDNTGASVGSRASIYGTTFNASASVTADSVYYILVYYYSNPVTYKIARNTTSAAPAITIPTATELTADEWGDGNITTAGGEEWFKFTTGASQTAVIHFMYGTGTDALSDVIVRVYAAAGTTVGTAFSLSTSTTSSNRTGLTANTDYYIRVITYYDFSTSKGTYKIGFNTTTQTSPVVAAVPTSGVAELTAVNTWVDGSIAAIDSAQWFKFTSTGTTQYIYFQTGTMTNIYIQLYNAEGRMVGGRSSLYSSSRYAYRGVTNGTEYYVKVTPYYSSASTSGAVGAFKLAFGTTTAVPAN
jgi:hypothetical protein